MDMDPGTDPRDIPLHQDFPINLNQLPLSYTTQVAEVASPIVSSTSPPEQECPSVAMVQLRGSTCARQSDNIGSIITMLIDDQNVDIDEILTEEQYRQVSQVTGVERDTQMGQVGESIMGQTDLQTKIKEELPLSDHVDYAYQGAEYSFQMRDFRNSSDWSGLDTAALVGGPVEQHQERSGHLLKQNVVTVPSIHQDRGGGCRDEKYWERRRKNNLAAKKSRDTRRVRENQLRLRVLFLENANKVLREQMDRKELETGELRERLRSYENDQNCQNSQ